MRTKVLLVALVVFAIWGWCDVRLRGYVDPQNPTLHKTDFTVYTEAGAAFFDGRDPYSVTNARGWNYLYPPLFAIVVAPLHALPPEFQVLVWFGLSMALAWGCHGECVRIARAVIADEDRGPFGPIPSWIGYAAILAVLVPALNCLQRGQVGVAKLFLLLLGYRLLVESTSRTRSFVAGVVLAAPIVLKITPVVPVLFVVFERLVAAVFTRERRVSLREWIASPLGLGAGLALFLLIVPGALVGWNANLHHLESWWNRVALRAEDANSDDFAGDSTSVRNQSFTNGVRHLGNWIDFAFAGGPDDMGPEQLRQGGNGLLMDAAIVDPLLLAARVLAGCLLLAVGYRMARLHDALGQTAAFGLACAATLIVVSVARVHYFVMLLPAVMFVSAWLLRHGRTRAAVVAAVVPAVLVFAHYTLMEVTGRMGLLGVGITVWYATVGVAMLRIAPSAATVQATAPARFAATVGPPRSAAA